VPQVAFLWFDDGPAWRLQDSTRFPGEIVKFLEGGTLILP
jgi:hypothetical protein